MGPDFYGNIETTYSIYLFIIKRLYPKRLTLYSVHSHPTANTFLPFSTEKVKFDETTF